MQKFLENLQEAEVILQAMDHLIYVTFPIVKDKKMLVKILEKTGEAAVLCINSILQYDYLFRRVRIFASKDENLRTFKEKCAPRYGLNPREVENLMKLLKIAEFHKKSPLEFTRENKIVILSENMGHEIITPEKVKEFVSAAKNLLSKAKFHMKTNYS